MQELVDAGGHQEKSNEILMQGGLNPMLGGDIYVRLVRAIKQAVPEVTEVVTNILQEQWDPPEFLGPMEIIYPDFVNVQEL
jgi:2-iminoacetate synthase ThiH